jgi:hypothetical protein
MALTPLYAREPFGVPLGGILRKPTWRDRLRGALFGFRWRWEDGRVERFLPGWLTWMKSNWSR